MSDLTITIKGTSESPAKFVAEARNFKMIIDQPTDLGGTDKGATPLEYLFSAFAGCLNVVGQLVASEMGIKFNKLEIEVTGNINPARFMGQDYTERSGFKNINVSLKPYSTASSEQLSKWVEEVKRRCPLNDNISNTTPVKISIANI